MCLSFVSPLCASYYPYNSSIIFLLPKQGSVMVWYPKVKHKLLFVLSISTDTMTQCSDNRLQLLLRQKKSSEHLRFIKENLMYHLWMRGQLCQMKWKNEMHAINTNQMLTLFYSTKKLVFYILRYVINRGQIFYFFISNTKNLNKPFFL